MSSTSLTPLSLEISLTMIDPFFRLWLCRFLVWYRLNPITGSSFLVDSVGISNGENVWFVSPTSSMFSSGLIHAISTKVRFLFYFCLCELNPFVDYFPKFCLDYESCLCLSGKIDGEVVVWSREERTMMMKRVSSDNCGYGIGGPIRQRSFLYAVLFDDLKFYKSFSWVRSLSRLLCWFKTVDWLNLHCLNCELRSVLCFDFKHSWSCVGDSKWERGRQRSCREQQEYRGHTKTSNHLSLSS